MAQWVQKQLRNLSARLKIWPSVVRRRRRKSARLHLRKRAIWRMKNLKQGRRQSKTEEKRRWIKPIPECRVVNNKCFRIMHRWREKKRSRNNKYHRFYAPVRLCNSRINIHSGYKEDRVRLLSILDLSSHRLKTRNSWKIQRKLCKGIKKTANPCRLFLNNK